MSATASLPSTDDLVSKGSCEEIPADHAMGASAAAQVAATLKALADPLRVRMLSLIAASPTGEACVCNIATVADVTQSTVSHHLKVLKGVGVLTSERRASWVFYRIAPQARRAVTTLLEAFAPVVVASRERSEAMPGLADADAHLERMADEFMVHYPTVSADLVSHTVRESYVALARGAAGRADLVPTGERFARQRLDDIVAAQRPAGVAHRPQVLFVCVANAGRSQLAASLLRHYAGDAVVVRSAGSAPAGDVHDVVRASLADLADLADDVAYPKPLTDDAVRAADVIITMGCGDTCPILPGKVYEDWIVGDPALASPEGVLAIRCELDARVRVLVAQLLPDHALAAS